MIKEITVSVSKKIYDCGNSKHRHITYEVAKKCQERAEAVKKRTEEMYHRGNLRTKQNLANIAISYFSGESLKSIGEREKISLERVRQLVHKVARKIDYSAFNWEIRDKERNANVELIKKWLECGNG